MPPQKRGRPRKSTDQTPQSNRSALSAKSNPPAASSASTRGQSHKTAGKQRRASKRSRREQDEEDELEVDDLEELPSTVAAAPTSAASGKKRKRESAGAAQKRTSSSGAAGAKGNKTSTNANKKQEKKKRKASDAELDEDDNDASTTATVAATADGSTGQQQPQRKKFAHLKPRTRHISQSVITTKWRPAPLPAQHAARALFVAAKRPVVEAVGRRGASEGGGGAGAGGAYDRRRAEAEATLASVLRKLEKQVPRIPFPGSLHKRGGGPADVFELEKVVERNRGLEAQLTPAVHAVKLLREAVRREEGVLEEERAALEVLRRRAREAERVGRVRGRKGLHPVLKRWRTDGDDVEVDDSVEDIRLAPAKGGMGDGDEDDGVSYGEEFEGDEELAPVLKQLRGHLDSMRTNLEQIEGLDEAMTGARVALDEVLRKKLSEEQYQGLVTSSS